MDTNNQCIGKLLILQCISVCKQNTVPDGLWNARFSFPRRKRISRSRREIELSERRIAYCGFLKIALTTWANSRVQSGKLEEANDAE